MRRRPALHCASNLKQIGLAAHHYAGTHNRLPPGFLGPYPDKGMGLPPVPASAQFVGVLAYLLPYIEQDNTYRLLTRDLPSDYLNPNSVYAPWWNYDSALAAARVHIKLYECPADDPYSNTLQIDVLAHTFRQGSGFELFVYGIPMAQGGSNLGRSNYIGVAGFGGTVNIAAVDQYAGLFCNRSGVSLEQLTAADGSSNTLMFGEWLDDYEVGTRSSPPPGSGRAPCRRLGGSAASPAPAGSSSAADTLAWCSFAWATARCAASARASCPERRPTTTSSGHPVGPTASWWISSRSGTSGESNQPRALASGDAMDCQRDWPRAI